MSIFTHDQRACSAWISRVSNDAINSRIHRANHIRGQMPTIPIAGNRPFIMQRARRVIATHPSRHGIMGRAITAFVAQRPHDDTGMVFIALNHTHPTLNKSMKPFRFMSKFSDLWGVRIGIRNVGAFEIDKLIYVIEIGAGIF